jgi:hypothetical protein
MMNDELRIPKANCCSAPNLVTECPAVTVANQNQTDSRVMLSEGVCLSGNTPAPLAALVR